MIKGWNVVAAGAVILALSGCYGFRDSAVQKATPTGSAFDKALYTEYKGQSRSESLQGNYQTSDLWAERGLMAAKGQSPKPLPPNHFQQPTFLQPEINRMSQRLESALSRGGAQAAPEAMAKAQMGYECYTEQTRVAENFQPDDIGYCRALFLDNIAKVEKALTPAPKPVAAKPSDFLVFFDWDKYNLTPEAMKVITDAANAAKASGAKMISIIGHTDTSGSAAYNLKLSERRAQAVAAAMEKMGIPATSMQVIGRGQTDLLVPTPDGVREPQNRRAAISFPKAGANLDTRSPIRIEFIN